MLYKILLGICIITGNLFRLMKNFYIYYTKIIPVVFSVIEFQLRSKLTLFGKVLFVLDITVKSVLQKL
jgi:hypothetical protein